MAQARCRFGRAVAVNLGPHVERLGEVSDPQSARKAALVVGAGADHMGRAISMKSAML